MGTGVVPEGAGLLGLPGGISGASGGRDLPLQPQANRSIVKPTQSRKAASAQSVRPLVLVGWGSWSLRSIVWFALVCRADNYRGVV